MQREIKTEQHKATTLFTLIEKSLISSRGSGRAWQDQEEYSQINVKGELQHVNFNCKLVVPIRMIKLQWSRKEAVLYISTYNLRG